MKLTDKQKQVLAALDIHSVQELVTYYPMRYETTRTQPIAAWKRHEQVCFSGRIASQPVVVFYRGKQSYTRFLIEVEAQQVAATIFNRPWVSAFVLDSTMYFKAKVTGDNQVSLQSYAKQPYLEGIAPVYRLKKGIPQSYFSKLIKQALTSYNFEDFLDAQLCSKYRLISRSQALHEIHAPTSETGLKQALRHLKYEEFFRFQLGVQQRKLEQASLVKAHTKVWNEPALQAFIASLPFVLSEGQQQAITEIVADLSSQHVMQRLLQGDVGCGKTVVAMVAAYVNTLAGYQSACLAPTQILAQQHFASFQAFFAHTDIRIELLHAGLKPKEKREVLQKIATGKVDLVLGTHALFQEQVQFANLGLAIIDEQQRFGVAQRKSLRDKGSDVDVLLMSATPIPRTMAFSLFGDLDVSSIETMPKKRKKKITKYVKGNSLQPILPQLKASIAEGNQVYVVCPAIEANEQGVRSAESVYQAMKKALKEFEIGLVHGKLKQEEKADIMQRFQAQEIQILVATSVIEVGVDVPSANVMVIYDAHRFGLSQLHQLRGRVGRHQAVGTCYLLSDSEDADARARLQVLVKSQDGFEIARQDLAQRGFGDLLGQRQSGVPSFKLANVVADEAILEAARNDAVTIVAQLSNYPKYQTYIQEHQDHTID
ncbi:MAG: ATP-dependent DNA helicase RecG [Erysipelotrichaceae bacterium]